MKRLPRDLSGKQLIKILQKLDYSVTRQVGSYIRLTTEKKRNSSPDNSFTRPHKNWNSLFYFE